VGRRVTGPDPLRETSKSEIKDSVPVRKCVPGVAQRREEGVRYVSVVRDTRVYVERVVGVEERVFVRRMGRSVGVVRRRVVFGSVREYCGYEARQLREVGYVWVVYGLRFIGEEESRSVGGRMKVRMVSSAEEVRRVVPSGDLRLLDAFC
jgi:hypothetical protein